MINPVSVAFGFFIVINKCKSNNPLWGVYCMHTFSIGTILLIFEKFTSWRAVQ